MESVSSLTSGSPISFLTVTADTVCCHFLIVNIWKDLPAVSCHLFPKLDQCFLRLVNNLASVSLGVTPSLGGSRPSSSLVLSQK